MSHGGRRIPISSYRRRILQPLKIGQNCQVLKRDGLQAQTDSQSMPPQRVIASQFGGIFLVLITVTAVAAVSATVRWGPTPKTRTHLPLGEGSGNPCHEHILFSPLSKRQLDVREAHIGRRFVGLSCLSHLSGSTIHPICSGGWVVPLNRRKKKAHRCPVGGLSVHPA